MIKRNQKLQNLLKIHKTTKRPGEGQMYWSSYVPRYLSLALKTLQAPRPKLELFRRHQLRCFAVHWINGFLYLAISSGNPIGKSGRLSNQSSGLGNCQPIISRRTPNCPSRGEIPKILKLAWGKAFVEVVAMRRLACV